MPVTRSLPVARGSGEPGDAGLAGRPGRSVARPRRRAAPPRRVARPRVRAHRRGTVGPPLWRGRRRFFLRRTARQEHAVLTPRPRRDQETLIDPMEIDPSGLTTLDKWQPDLDGRLLAYQLSRPATSGRNCGSWTSAPARSWTARSTVAATPRWPGSPAGIPSTTSAPVRSACTGSGPGRDHIVICGAERSYGLVISYNGRWLTVSAPSGRRNDLWLADLSSSSPRPPGPAGDPGRAGRGDGVHRRPRRAPVPSHRPWSAPGPPVRRRSGSPAPEHWNDLVPGSEAVIGDFTVSPATGSWSPGPGTRSARSASTT